ncbi:hypothetical protein BU25DRAFT_421702 [Macroventuria anomochaeta]|uniref:Uncharacterized protein n=1 Tax=Macroventuria anomochaeta TaxID=301207 RepID=A0ACB6S1B2_9PLEO|nr:uncharacterized protein BU25DRAFT_421702 [Macroventuria anomochaeta]KAF2627733.1 hypothetical protein BU25DRAFT_421702 [Macroventuria anomochaeta]
MAEKETRESRALSLSPDRFLAAPPDCPINGKRSRSVSAAPSFRSTQSHVTTVEEKEDIPGFEVADLEKKQVQRQQTYKFGRSVGLMDRIKGVFFPRTLMAKMEESIEVIPSLVPDDEESPWIVDIHVSPKFNSLNYHKTLCLLDTGCSHGNIVSKDFVDALGFTESDYQDLSDLESQGGVTMAGQPFPVEAAIFLSWHHNTSLKRFRQMRFLISSHARNFEMIIGAQTICKYNLMSRPVFNLESGVVNSSSKGKLLVYASSDMHSLTPITDESQNHLINERSALKSRIEEIEDLVEKEKNAQKVTQLRAELTEINHLLTLKRVEINLRDAKTEDAKKMSSLEIEKITKAWDTKRPKNTTNMVKDRYQTTQDKAIPAQASIASNGIKSANGTSKGTKKSSTSNGDLEPS